MEILAAAEALRVPAAVDLAAIVIGALTGGLLAAREGFAVSGVLLLAVSGGLGGGLIRDVLLGDLPPVALTNQAYLPTVAITAAVTFFFSGWLSRLTALLVVLDAVTLGFFTVIGAQKAQLVGLPSASVVFIGTLTAVGGAVIRDVLLAQRADIVQPGPYNAVAALIGAAALTVLAGPLGLDPLPVAAIVIVLVAGAAGAVGVARLGGAGRRRPAAARPQPARPPPDARAALTLRRSVPASGMTSGAGSMLAGTTCGPASGGRGSSCGCSRTASMATSSSASGRNSRSSTRSHSSSSGRPAHSRSTSTQLGGAGVEVAVAALDQPVGVEQHASRPASRTVDVLLALGVRGRRPAAGRRRRRPAARALPSAVEHGRRRVPGARPAQPDLAGPQVVLVLLEAGDQRGRHGVQRQPLRWPGPAR